MSNAEVNEAHSLSFDILLFLAPRTPNKMSLHSTGLFRLWTASGSIDHPRMACFAFLARAKNARSRCDDHFVRRSRFCGSLLLGITGERLRVALRVPGACRRFQSSARERAVFSHGKDGEAGDVGSIVDAAGCSQAEEGPLEARSNSSTGS